MFNFLQDSTFTANRQSNKHYVFRNVQLETPSWSDILNNLNTNVVSNTKIKILDNLGFVTLDAENIILVKPLFEAIKLTTSNKCSAHCYISLLEISGTFGRHNDNADVFFWQVQGSSKWVVEQDSVCEYILYPNDIIYIPRFVIHEVQPLGPRAGISIGIDY
jgi:mannose-6-phosphate isomerase-like protein (cupin superfamily)